MEPTRTPPSQVAISPPKGEIEILWSDSEFTLARVRQGADGAPTMLVRSAATDGAASLVRLEHAHALRDELESSWAARPIELIEHRGQLALRIVDPGGRVLATLLGKPW